MPTREEITTELLSAAAQGDTQDAAPQQDGLAQLNGAMADVDDELEAVARKLTWLSTVTWTNERPVAEFGAFVEAKIAECEAVMAAIRKRWLKEWGEQNPNAAGREAAAGMPDIKNSL
jgi:hypothetical protein